MVDLPQSYRHPGQAFLSRQFLFEEQVEDERDVLNYVDFLRQAAHLSDEPPIDLTPIYEHFGMPMPVRVPLIDQQGILVDSDAGLILIKEDDSIVRQRFTEGHELMELLFDALDRVGRASKQDHDWKERQCDRGAAELLMPRSSFLPKLQALGLSLPTGQTLAKQYQTSLISTLIHMMELSAEPAALIMWHSALTRKQAEHPGTIEPPRKLRVWWRICTAAWQCGFIPKNKSISSKTLIYQTYRSKQAQLGTATIDLGGGAFTCQIETLPLAIGDKSAVLSLLKPIHC